MANYALERSMFQVPLRKKYCLCDLPLHKKYRSHFEIMALILEATKDDGEARFSIMTHASINFKQLKEFLNCLIEMGFIDMDMKEGRVLYRANERGLSFLRQYHVLLEMLLNRRAQGNPHNISA